MRRCPGGPAAHLGERHLVRPERALDLHPLDPPWARSSPWASRERTSAMPVVAGCCRSGPPPGWNRSRPARSRAWSPSPVHRLGLVAGHDAGHVAVAGEECCELVPADPREHRRVGDLIAVEVEDRQHRAVAGRIEDLVRVPAGGGRSRLGLAVADDADRQKVGIVENGTAGVKQRVAELAALVDRARRLRDDVARHIAREGEPGEEPLQPGLGLRDVW